MQAVSSLSSIALSLNCKTMHYSLPFTQESKSYLTDDLMFFEKNLYRDCEFLCRAYFPSSTQFYIRWRHVEGGQSILHLRLCAIVVDVLPVQNVQIAELTSL